MAHVSAFLRSRLFVALAAVWAIIMFDWLFYGHVIGWTVGLFVGFAAVLIVLRCPQALHRRAAQCCGAVLAGLIVALVLAPGLLGILLASLALATWSLLMKNAWAPSVRANATRALSFVANLFARIIVDSLLAGRWFRTHAGSRLAPMRMALLWIVPLALGLIFAILFAVANPIIEDWLARFGSWLWDVVQTWREFLQPARIGLWVAVLLAVWALLRPRRERRFVAIKVPPRQHRDPARAWRAVIRCLAVFNLIFAVQTVLDLAYLWGGAALPSGMTYAQYAHRGAYPLVATALLAGLFVLITFRHGGPAERSPAARRLVYLWIGQNLLLMASTLWRLKLYVDVYSLTRLRLAAMIWMILVALGFVWVIWRIVRVRSNTWLLHRNILAAAAILYVCAFIDFDGLIAEFNVAHCREFTGSGVSLDVDYLAALGPASIPALETAADRLPPAEQVLAREHLEQLRLDLRNDLADWRGWTFRRWRLAAQTAAEAPLQTASQDR